jgi:hypothetical protein
MPRSKYHNWTKAEESELIELVNTHGQKWLQFKQTHFPMFSVQQIKSKYFMLRKYKRALVDPDHLPDAQTLLDEEVYRKLKQILNRK